MARISFGRDNLVVERAENEAKRLPSIEVIRKGHLTRE